MLRAVDEPLRLTEADTLVVGYVSDFSALLRAVDETMPKDSTLCLEGTSLAPDVVSFLERRQAPVQSAIAPNTLWPKPGSFHLSLEGTDLRKLRELAEHHAEPEIADHLVVYRGEHVLLWAHDAGYGYVEVSSSLPEETIERFRAALGSAVRPEK